MEVSDAILPEEDSSTPEPTEPRTGGRAFPESNALNDLPSLQSNKYESEEFLKTVNDEAELLGFDIVNRRSTTILERGFHCTAVGRAGREDR